MECIKFRYIFQNEPPKNSPVKEVEKQPIKQLNGKSYSIYRVTENCSVAKRIVIFITLFFPFIISFGAILLDPRLRAKAKSIFTGKILTNVAVLVPDAIHLDNQLTFENQNSNFEILNQFFQKLEIQHLSKLAAVSKKTKKNVDTYFDKNIEKKIEKLLLLKKNSNSYFNRVVTQIFTKKMDTWFIRNRMGLLIKDVLKEKNFFDVLKTLPDDAQKELVIITLTSMYLSEYDESQPDFILANALTANKNIVKMAFELQTDFNIYFFLEPARNVTLIQQLFHELSTNSTILNKLLQNQSLIKTILPLLMNIKPLYEKNRVSYGYQAIYPGFAKELIEKYRNLYPNSAELAQTLATPEFQKFVAELG